MAGKDLKSTSLNIGNGVANIRSALSPTRPFPKFSSRMRLAGILIPALYASFFVTGAMFIKTTTFFMGFLFFGQPVMDRCLHWLNCHFPRWKEILDIRKYAFPLSRI